MGINLDILKINYKDNSYVLLNKLLAKFEIRLLEGGIKKYLSSRDMITCWVNDTERGKRILEGN